MRSDKLTRVQAVDTHATLRSVSEAADVARTFFIAAKEHSLTGTQVIESDGVISVVRLEDFSSAVDVAEALVAGGLRAIEFTFTNRDAATAIHETRRDLGERATIGAGSVLDPETARTAILAGAEFVVTPTLNRRTIELCHRYGVPIVVGAFTPTEILTAWEAGAPLVKVFPASVGGPSYLKDLLGPLPQVKLVPTGGVTLGNAGDFIRAGAMAVALGSNLVDARTVASGDWSILTHRAESLLSAVTKARSLK